LPERRLIVRATASAADGAPVAEVERAYGRHLVDVAGKPAPFFRAVRVDRDDRIGPRETRTETLELAGPAGAGTLTVRVIWRSLAADIAAQIRFDGAQELVLAEATIPFGPARPGKGRARLPRRVAVTPPRQGDTP
jgi:hypothetical protein